MNYKELFLLSSRYILLILIASSNLWLFYQVFTPLTLYPSYTALRVLYSNENVSLDKTLNQINIGEDNIMLIPACVAGAAYYLLLILNLTTPMGLKNRLKSLGFVILSFLIINILRIVLLAILFLNGSFEYFNLAHQLTWYLGSTLLILVIWFLNIKMFNIDSIPIYSDIMSILKDIRFSSKSKKRLRR